MFQGSLVFNALKMGNVEAVKIMLTEDNLEETVGLTIHENRLDLLSYIAEVRPEITQEHMIAQLLKLHRRSLEGEENEDDALSIFIEQDSYEVQDEQAPTVNVMGWVDNVQYYQCLEH